MNIFLSHSGQQKPLVRDIARHFPEHIIRIWLDEYHLRVGDSIPEALEEEISKNSGYFIFFIDDHAIRSEWVRKEVEWALQREKTLKRTFILPVVIDASAWDQLPYRELKDRKYLRCYDKSEHQIKDVALELISELFAILSREQDSHHKQLDSLDLVDQVDQHLQNLASVIRDKILRHRRDFPLESPLNMSALFEHVRNQGLVTADNHAEFYRWISRLRRAGLLAGIVISNDDIFLEEEHFAWKSGLFTDIKNRIADEAVKRIQSGHKVALDGGSTTLHVAKKIGEKLQLQIEPLNNLTIVTNSIPVAHTLLTTASEMGLEDDNEILTLYIVSGRVRCNTLAIVNPSQEIKLQSTSLNSILELIEGTDISFVGTNGISKDLGFSTHTPIEASIKREMLQNSQQGVIVSDPSKFTIEEQEVFATLDDKIDLITTKDKDGTVFNDFKVFFETTQINIIEA